MNKKCKGCGEIKLINEFYVTKRKKKNKRYGGKDFWPVNPCRKCKSIYMTAWFKKHPDIKRKFDSKHKRKIRLKALNHYSKNNPECVCCGEKEIDFLCLDHIDNDGKLERIIMGKGFQFYQNLVKGKFKSNLQILCYNCHACKSKYGGCPHKRIK